MRQRRGALVVAWASLALLGGLLLGGCTRETPRRVVLIGGADSEGPGRHDYPQGVRALEALLASSPGLDVVAYPEGWPRDPAALDNATAVVWYFDGVDKHPLRDPARRAVERRLQRRVHLVRARQQEQPGGVAVQSVHHPWAFGVVTAGDAAGERLHERPGAVARARVHDHAGGLVDDEQVLVLPRDRVRGVGDLGALRLRQLGDHDPLARRDRVALGTLAAVDEHRAALEQALGGRARAGAASRSCP